MSEPETKYQFWTLGLGEVKRTCVKAPVRLFGGCRSQDRRRLANLPVEHDGKSNKGGSSLRCPRCQRRCAC